MWRSAHERIMYHGCTGRSNNRCARARCKLWLAIIEKSRTAVAPAAAAAAATVALINHNWCNPN